MVFGIFRSIKKSTKLVKISRVLSDVSMDFDMNSMDVRGLHLLSGLPRSVNLQAGELREAMAEPLNKIVDAVGKRNISTG